MYWMKLNQSMKQNSRKLIYIPKARFEHKNIIVLWIQGIKIERFWSVGQT